jgi:hypothetical protein
MGLIDHASTFHQYELIKSNILSVYGLTTKGEEIMEVCNRTGSKSLISLMSCDGSRVKSRPTMSK